MHRFRSLNLQKLCFFTIWICWPAFAFGETDSPFANRSGLDPSGFNRSIRVQDDLYRAVNGSWLSSTEIPSDKSNYGSFTALDDNAQENIRAILEEIASGDHPQGSNEQKLRDFYLSFMNESRVEELGAKPLGPILAEIDSLETKADVVEFFGKCLRRRIMTPIRLYVGQDDKDSSRYLTAISQGGTTLPDRDFYLKLGDPKFRSARAALHRYIETCFQLADLETEFAADEIMMLESRLAAAKWPRTRMRNADETYNLTAVDDFQQQSNHIDWKSFLRAAGLNDIAELNVMTPSFFQDLDTIIADVSVATWKNYLRFHAIDRAAPLLSKNFVDAHFNLHQRVLAGVPKQQPRWKRAVKLVAGGRAGDFGALGEVVGQLYVDRHFKPEAKARMDELVANLLKAFESSIDDLTWMTDATKAKAQQKLAKITPKIGYPNKWRDYSALEVDPADLFGNAERSSIVEYRRMIDKLGQPVDREEWGMTPHTVNAYYNPGKNEIVFPAAILQPPFFNSDADDAVNYGGIGAVIGHEISHGFDDQGSKYDGDGNLKNWWTDKDREAFSELTERLVAQYSAYSPLPGKHVNGQLTLGENIADLSGLSIAHKAYRLSLNDQPAPELAGWTGDQRFFLGWSQVWRRKYRDAEMMRRLLTDPHSPSWYRANGPVINIDAFYEAFNAKPGDALYRAPEERIRIW